MKKPQIITYHGVEIIYLDFTNMKRESDILSLEDEGARLIQKYDFNTALTLTNMDGMYFNNTIRMHFVKRVQENTPHVKASAVIGLNGLIALMYKSFVRQSRRNVKLFSKKEEALDYLVSFMDQHQSNYAD
ncbi:MAG: hypothetical protein JXR22_08525 [Prolixibacteraceae bacterium]|nr:hypothetical protein [Prolixibacteraceae bacterium]